MSPSGNKAAGVLPVSTPETSQGPFSEYLLSAKRPEPQQQSGWGGTPALVMGIADSFLRGAQQGRVASFLHGENEKQKKITEFDGLAQSYYTDPDLTPEGKQLIKNVWMTAKGQHIMEAADSAGGQGGGQGKGGKSGKGGNPLVQIFREIGLGMTGGKMPEGAKAVVDPDKAIAEIARIAKNPQYSVRGGVDTAYADAQKAVQGEKSEFFQDKFRAAEPHIQRMNALDPAQRPGDAFAARMQGQFQPRPTFGSAEDLLSRAVRGTAPPPTVAGEGMPQGTAVPVAAPPNAGAGAGGSAAPPAPAQPAAPSMDMTPPLLAALVAGKKYAKEAQVRYPDENGELQHTTAYQVSIGPGISWYSLDRNGSPKQLDPSKVVRTGTGEPAYQAHERLAFDSYRQGHPEANGRPLEAKEKVQAIADYEKSIKPGGSVAQTNEQIAFDAFRERHKVSSGQDLTGTQKLQALKEMKELTEPGDVANMKAIGALLSQERLNLIREGRADAKLIAEAIVDGTQPPDLTRLYGHSAQVRGELARQGYDLREAQLDWQATTKHIATLNSTSQVRLRQATNFAYESLDLVEELSKQVSKAVPRSQFPMFNKAALAMARGGAFGQEAQTAANNLQIQIRDLQSELATVYKGGGSPTDRGIKSAMDMLEGDWSEKTLHEAVDLSKKNLRIRLNSISNTGPIGPHGYTPTATPPGAAGIPPDPFSTAPPPVRPRSADQYVPPGGR